MPNIECLLTLNDSLLLVEPDGGPAGLLSPIHGAVGPGESPIEACINAVHRHTGFRVSPSCAGVLYGSGEADHDYTLVFVADAPQDISGNENDTLLWVELAGFRHRKDIPALQRQLIPLLLTTDTPLAVLLEGASSDPAAQVKETAPIAHARLSPLVFAVAT